MGTHRAADSAVQRRESSKLPAVSYVAFVLVVACIIAILHRNHLSGMHENDRHFSHLSTLERELSFRTEMGLYYSYFKTVINAASFQGALYEIMNDNVTEFPSTINTLQRFNLYPEVVLGLSYRWFMDVTKWLNIPTMTCWSVHRGQGLSSIVSCEGIGDPAYFYIEAAFLLNGILLGVLFVFGIYLSGSVVGGLLTAAAFFYNHAECTRVQWTPPLRESFSFPFLVVEMFLVTHTLRLRQPSYWCSVFIALATVCFMLPWQFAQFALLTQTLSVFGVYILQFIGSHKVKVVIVGQLAGSIVSTVLLFGNKMMISSFFVSCILSFSIVLLLESLFEKIQIRFIIWVCQVVVLCVGTLIIKKLTAVMLNVTDDAHIFDILRSKFTDFRNFHTMLYTCAVEFDFMEAETPVRLLKTLLIPSVIVVTASILYQIVRNEFAAESNAGKKSSCLSETSADSISPSPSPQRGHKRGELSKSASEAAVDGVKDGAQDVSSEIQFRSKPHAELVYHVFQCILFTTLAVIIMRLKLFWTPHLCLMTSLLASKQLSGWIGDTQRHYVLLAVVAGLMSVEGSANVQRQWNIAGEYQNIPTEQLMNWINENTSPHDSFAGPMSLMANVKLSTGRPVVNHPHYEDAHLRARTMQVYTLFSRKPEREVWLNFRHLRVHYAVLENAWCAGRSERGCGMAEIWDIEDVDNRHQQPVCERLAYQPEPYFRRVFRNHQYDILEVVQTPPGEQ